MDSAIIQMNDAIAEKNGTINEMKTSNDIQEKTFSLLTKLVNKYIVPIEEEEKKDGNNIIK